MADKEARLAQEAKIFSEALIGQPASDYVARQYARGHVALPLAPEQGFDAVLMRVARNGPLFARIADAYASRFAKRAILRRKLSLMLAILESSSPGDRAFTPIAASPAGVVFRLAAAGTVAIIFTLLGIAFVGPLHLASRLGSFRS